MSKVPRASRMDAATRSIECLRGVMPGTASTAPQMEPNTLSKMTKVQLRDLATRTPGTTRDKKTSESKCVPKTTKELKGGLLAIKARFKAKMPVSDSIKAKGRSVSRPLENALRHPGQVAWS